MYDDFGEGWDDGYDRGYRKGYDFGVLEGEGKASVQIEQLEHENNLLRDRIDKLISKINELQETLDAYRRGME